MEYRIYNPTVTEQTVIDPYDNEAGLTYVSNSSLEYWGGKYWAIMDGGVGQVYEGESNQQIWLTTSTDGQSWSAAHRPFHDSAYCINPLPDGNIEWQPNLVVVGDELWCTWSGLDSYISKLASPTAKWTNYRFEFSGQQPSISTTVTGAATGGSALRPTIDGISDWLPFFSQNPIVLSSGVVACPLTFYSATQSTQTTASSSFVKSLKYNALLLADGQEWSLSLIDTQQWGDFIAWEPFVVENPVGHLYVYHRNLDARSVDDDFMLVSVSTDGGSTFSAAESTNILVPSTRGFARRVSPKRWVMVHNDHPQNSTQAVNQSLSLRVRRNGAIFVSRRGVTDFVPGVNFSGDSISANYPQFIVGPDNSLLVNYTDNVGGPVRRSLKLVTVSPLPDDNYAYVHPRSIGVYSPVSFYDPELVPGPPAYYSFNGINRLWSADPLVATTGLSYSAWVQWDRDGSLLMDSRQNSPDADDFGQVFFTGGASIQGLNILHSLTITPGSPVFIAATFDPAAAKATVYACQGGASFNTATAYYRSFEISDQPEDGDTITVNGVTYTFETEPTLTNDIEISEQGYFQTVDNAITKIKTNSMQAVAAGTNRRIIMMRSDLADFAISSTSSNITADSSTPLDGGPVSFGSASGTSGLLPFAGRIYEARVHDSALTLANMTNLYNARAESFAYDTISGTSTAPGAALFYVNPASPNDTIDPAGSPATCEVISESVLRINGETSASVELPYAVTLLKLQFKLGAAPTGDERYTIATFGSKRRPVRLYIDADNPTKLYANDLEVLTIADVTAYNSVFVTVSTNKISIGNLERDFLGRPRCYLGDAFPQELLTPDRYVDFNVSNMIATRR